MTTTIELPALDGRDALGFLAALGTLRLLNEHADTPARLSFNPQTAHAQLHSRLTHIDDIVTTLVDIIATIPENGVIPDAPANFPRPKNGVEPDPMRVTRDKFHHLTHPYKQAGPTTARWFAALLTDLAVDAANRAALTPFTAPAGQQSLRSFFEKPLTEVRKDPPTLIRQALTRWRRIDGYTGEYLDHRVLRGAADHPSGKSVEAGVPGATWLAIMALPLLRLTGTGTTTQSTLWHTLPGRHQPIMTWPIWRQPLDPHAVTALLEHPDLRPTLNDGQLTTDPRSWTPLGVLAITAATRQPVEGRKSAGPLTPINISTQRPPSTR